MGSHEQARNRNQRILSKANDYTVKELALIFDVKEHTIYNVLRANNVSAKKARRGRPQTQPTITDDNQRVIDLLNQGISAANIAKQLGISRQRVYQIKDKAVELGAIQWERSNTAQVKTCPVCQREFTGNNKTCSQVCAKQSVSRKNTKNSKWSRNTYTTFECTNCGQTFQRSNYMKAIREAGEAAPTNHYFCSRNCNLKYQAKRQN